MDAMRRSSGEAASSASTATASSGGLSPAGRYQLGELVGSGSFGEVYKG